LVTVYSLPYINTATMFLVATCFAARRIVLKAVPKAVSSGWASRCAEDTNDEGSRYAQGGFDYDRIA
jgi:hypothetical protein